MARDLHIITLSAIPGVPLIKAGDDVGTVICDCAEKGEIAFAQDDVLIIASKIISKAEGRSMRLVDVTPSAQAHELAAKSQKDPRLVELMLRESKGVSRVVPGMLIMEHRLGFICTSAGVDRSNAYSAEGDTPTLLPEDPDASARRIRNTIRQRTGNEIAVIINDSFGRPFRLGSVGMAIGFAGIAAIEYVSRDDLYGRRRNNQIALVDELAAAASALMGQTNEGRPAIICRGVAYTRDEQTSISQLIRPLEDELYK